MSLSAIKILPFVESGYTLDDLSAEEFDSIHELIHDAGYVADNYREWLQSADIQIIPVLFYNGLQEISDLMDNLDGFVLTGGSESFYKYEGYPSLYLTTIAHILKKAKEINDSGREFPLWGTCLGFEALIVAESEGKLNRKKVMNHVKLRERIHVSDNKLRSVQFFSEKELDDMEDIPLLYFNHMWGLSKWDIENLPELEDKIKIGANIDTDAQRNVAVWMEFVRYPFFGTQFHPEKEAMSGANPFNSKRTEQIGVEEEEENKVNTKKIKPEILGDFLETKKEQKAFFNVSFGSNEKTKENLQDTKKSTEKKEDTSTAEKDEAKDHKSPEEKRQKMEEKKKQNVKSNDNDSKEHKSVEIGSSKNTDTNINSEKEKQSENKKNSDKNEAKLEEKIDLKKKYTDLELRHVHVAFENKELKEQNLNEIEDGVDKIAVPIVSDPSLISKKYLNKVKKINQKFAKFFAKFITNGKRKIDKNFLDKQIYWLENIGTYYQVNVIRNSKN